MWRFRHNIIPAVQSIRLNWKIKFVLFCTFLALIEEAITTTMTNCAPLLGVQIGQAYITASANYLDVIALHGVSLFVSFFVAWSLLLWRYAFSPFSVFILFGITGTIVEILFGGPAHIAEYGMWSFVYGLTVWLPACCVPPERTARSPRWWHYPLAVFAPFPFMIFFPLLGIISLFFPHHPTIHFPPIQ
ncbi:MAG: Membrane protein [Verrucomicrobiales bacterium]|nr:Membrane protein [Verrucomicrobiales bacterium]